MPVRQYANAPATTLANSCTALTTSLTVASVTGLPITFPYTLIIDRGTATEEAVSVTAAAGTVLTVTRGIDGTTAFAHAQGAVVVHGITAQDIREANAHVNASSGVHGITGSVVGTTDTQTLTNKSLTSPTLTGTPTAPTPTAGDNDTSIATTAFVTSAINTAVAAAKLAMYPVGSIYMHTVNTNPSSFIGGTWVAWGSGRVPVGVDAAQSEFNTVEETGGAKTHTLTEAELPAHDHDFGGNSRTWSWGAGAAGADVYLAGVNVVAGAPPSNELGALTGWAASANAGSGSAHNNLQPYITCYMFKRTA